MLARALVQFCTADCCWMKAQEVLDERGVALAEWLCSHDSERFSARLIAWDGGRCKEKRKVSNRELVRCTIVFEPVNTETMSIASSKVANQRSKIEGGDLSDEIQWTDDKIRWSDDEERPPKTTVKKLSRRIHSKRKIRPSSLHEPSSCRRTVATQRLNSRATKPKRTRSGRVQVSLCGALRIFCARIFWSSRSCCCSEIRQMRRAKFLVAPPAARMSSNWALAWDWWVFWPIAFWRPKRTRTASRGSS